MRPIFSQVTLRSPVPSQNERISHWKLLWSFKVQTGNYRIIESDICRFTIIIWQSQPLKQFKLMSCYNISNEVVLKRKRCRFTIYKQLRVIKIHERCRRCRNQPTRYSTTSRWWLFYNLKWNTVKQINRLGRMYMVKSIQKYVDQDEEFFYHCILHPTADWSLPTQKPIRIKTCMQANQSVLLSI